jgi:hypothetical protein
MSALPFIVAALGAGFLLGALTGTLVERTRLSATPAWLLGGAAVAAAGAAVFAPGRPTGLRFLDAAMRAGFAAIMVCSAARARRRSLSIATAALALPIAFGAESANLAPLLVAVGVGSAAAALSGYLYPDRVPVLGVMIGAAASVAALRLPTSMPTAAPSLLAALAVAVLSISATRGMRSRTIRRIGTGTAALGGVGFVCAIAGSTALINARAQAERGLDNARLGLAAAQSGDTATAEQRFDTATGALSDASQRLRTPLARLGLAVPILSQHITVLRDLSGSAAGVVATARDTADRADLESLRADGAKLDLAKMRSLRNQVVVADDAIDTARAAIARAENPWLLPALKNRIESLSTQVDDAASSTADVRDILENVPPLLGSKGPRRYLLVLPTPAEARGSGGVIGNWGEITAVNGELSLTAFGRPVELLTNGVPISQRTTAAPEEFVARYRPFGVPWLWSNLTMSPDFPTTAAVLAEQYVQSGRQRVDGVISVDPIALQALFGALGPLRVPEWPEPLTSTNTARVLLHDAYVEKGGETPERRAFLQSVTQATWARLSQASIPTPKALIDALAPAAQGRHLQMWMADQNEQAYLTRIGITGAVPSIVGDSVGVVVNNSSESKIDWYLKRSVEIDVRIDAGSRVQSRIRIRLQNDAPPSGEDAYVLGGNLASPGTNRTWVSVYSPLPLLAGSVDGQPISVHTDRELGRNVYSVLVQMPPRSTKELTVLVAGIVTNANNRYILDTFTQPLVTPDKLTVSVRSSTGSPLTGEANLSGTGPSLRASVLGSGTQRFAVTSNQTS